MRDTNDGESPGDNGSRATTVSTTRTGKDDDNSINNDSNCNKG